MATKEHQARWRSKAATTRVEVHLDSGSLKQLDMFAEEIDPSTGRAIGRSGAIRKLLADSAPCDTANVVSIKPGRRPSRPKNEEETKDQEKPKPNPDAHKEGIFPAMTVAYQVELRVDTISWNDPNAIAALDYIIGYAQSRKNDILKRYSGTGSAKKARRSL